MTFEVLRREVPRLVEVELRVKFFMVEFMVWSRVCLGSADLLKLRTAVVILPFIAGKIRGGTG